MQRQTSLDDFLSRWAGDDDDRKAVGEIISAIAGGLAQIDALVASAESGSGTHLAKASGALLANALKGTQTAFLASEKSTSVVELNKNGSLAVAIDPLDGHANIETNVTVGSIFAILPTRKSDGGSTESVFYQPGTNLKAAGYAVYGPRTIMVFTTGDGSHMATLDRDSGKFIITRENMTINNGNREFAINVSNHRHWFEPVRAYIDDCLEGDEGLRGGNYNMRWIKSLTAETFRIMIQGGVFLYPGDARDGFDCGRLRLLYEAMPIAMVIEQAGGMATDGIDRILDMAPEELLQRVPLVFGAVDEVSRVREYHESPLIKGSTSPLFNSRGLFR